MKSALLSLLIIPIIAIGAFCQSTSQILFKGVLVDSLDTPLPDSTYQLTFRIYDDSLGVNTLWQSEPDIQIKTQNGHYEYSLSPLADSLAAYPQLWLKVDVKGMTLSNRRILIAYDMPSPATESSLATTSPAVDRIDAAEVTLPDLRSLEVPKSERRKLIGKNNETELKLLLKAGYDWPGKCRIYDYPRDIYNSRSAYSINSGFAAGAELIWFDPKSLFMAGLGMEYQSSRSFKDYDTNISFLSFYGAIRINVPLEKNAKSYPYFVGRLGFDIIADFRNGNHGAEQYDLKNGLTFAGGVGHNFGNRVVCEFLYRGHNGKIEDSRLKYLGFSFTLGVLLDLSR